MTRVTLHLRYRRGHQALDSIYASANDGVGGRIDVDSNDVPQLVDEFHVPGKLELAVR